ncbi:hypothetical protein H5410_061059 [Solanum commersonii]|uniref:Nucleoporin Nup54 alpha-helical domain-containing protein n=1 Tax=Solanum commersonii TaxID=4109 RepID=A0A9J5W6Q1_SOLCO|nr:hypothetical protein H5410_061059 [Solanum commersonii]
MPELSGLPLKAIVALLQDEVIVSDAERLQMTHNNVKMLQRHFQADTLPWIERMRHKEQGLQRRLLRVMRILEALEGKGCRLPLMKGEAELAEKLAAITRQLKGSGAELSRRVQNLLTICRVQNGLGGGSVYLPGSTKIHEQSLADMQETFGHAIWDDDFKFQILQRAGFDVPYFLKCKT